MLIPFLHDTLTLYVQSNYWRKFGDTENKADFFRLALVLSQIISEPTNFEPNKNPSCIDLVMIDQPNLILNCGTRASLDSLFHHQIIYCKVSFRIPPPP